MNRRSSPGTYSRSVWNDRSLAVRLGRLLALQVADEAGQRTGGRTVRGCTYTCSCTGHCTTRRISPNTSPRTARSGPELDHRAPIGGQRDAPPDGPRRRGSERHREPATGDAGDVQFHPQRQHPPASRCCAPASCAGRLADHEPGARAGRARPRRRTGRAPSARAATQQHRQAAAMPIHSRQPVSRPSSRGDARRPATVSPAAGGDGPSRARQRTPWTASAHGRGLGAGDHAADGRRSRPRGILPVRPRSGSTRVCVRSHGCLRGGGTSRSTAATTSAPSAR